MPDLAFESAVCRFGELESLRDRVRVWEHNLRKMNKVNLLKLYFEWLLRLWVEQSNIYGRSWCSKPTDTRVKWIESVFPSPWGLLLWVLLNSVLEHMKWNHREEVYHMFEVLMVSWGTPMIFSKGFSTNQRNYWSPVPQHLGSNSLGNRAWRGHGPARYPQSEPLCIISSTIAYCSRDGHKLWLVVMAVQRSNSKLIQQSHRMMGEFIQRSLTDHWVQAAGSGSVFFCFVFSK